MSSITFAAARAVVSYPLPAVFGTMNRRPDMGSSEAAVPGSALSAVAPQPVTNSAVAATRVAPNLSCLNIVLSLPCRVCKMKSSRSFDFAEALATLSASGHGERIDHCGHGRCLLGGVRSEPQ